MTYSETKNELKKRGLLNILKCLETTGDYHYSEDGDCYCLFDHLEESAIERLNGYTMSREYPDYIYYIDGYFLSIHTDFVELLSERTLKLVDSFCRLTLDGLLIDGVVDALTEEKVPILKRTLLEKGFGEYEIQLSISGTNEKPEIGISQFNSHFMTTKEADKFTDCLILALELAREINEEFRLVEEY